MVKLDFHSCGNILPQRPALDSCIIGQTVWKKNIGLQFVLMVPLKSASSTPDNYSLLQTKTSVIPELLLAGSLVLSASAF